MGHARCFACNKALAHSSVHKVQVAGELTIVFVGPDCFERINRAGDEGYQPPLGGPRLHIPSEEALQWDAEIATSIHKVSVNAKTVKLRISATIANEYASRCPDFLPLDKLDEGICTLTLEEARAVLNDAEHNSDRTAFDVGPYGMPLPIYNAYRALAKQVRTRIESAGMSDKS